MIPSPNHSTPTTVADATIVRDHVRRLDAATAEDHRVLLTELLVAAYPTSLVQDS